jgi:hypothetical protein
VTPGLLVRQNFRLEDIGASKVSALAGRLAGILEQTRITHTRSEAHSFLMQNKEQIGIYDVILDCTASSIFQMKLERDWTQFERRTPPFISIIIDAKASSSLNVVARRASDAGIWDAYIQLKHKLCIAGANKDLLTAFYSERAIKDLFQPEPGCSAPTFSGSTADATSLIGTALNLVTDQIAGGEESLGIAFSSHSKNRCTSPVACIQFKELENALVGGYRVRIAEKVYRETRAWVRQNNRIRSPQHETGGLLWGMWDDAIGVIWVFDASGPPPDSIHEPTRFVCGIEGTAEEHARRSENSRGTCGFVGFWHSHPKMESEQSPIDINGMLKLVSRIGQNHTRALMVIFGLTEGRPTAGIYIYESRALDSRRELVAVGEAQVSLKSRVV